jgi:hypothetical protein
LERTCFIPGDLKFQRARQSDRFIGVIRPPPT